MISALLVLSILANIIFFILLIICAFYLIKFARIIMNVEDALSDALEAFDKMSKSVTNILKMEMFYESPEVKRSVQVLLDDIKLSNIELIRVIKNFTNLSKEKYITVVREYDEEEDKI